MNKAVELFTAVPKLHNCAQAVADGAGNRELACEMAACGGGKAPLHKQHVLPADHAFQKSPVGMPGIPGFG